jgi:Flp pilus assembly pilin Flp
MFRYRAAGSVSHPRSDQRGIFWFYAKGGSMASLIKRLWQDEAGQGLPEYALLVAAVVVMVVAASILFTNVVKQLFTDIGTYIQANDGV